MKFYYMMKIFRIFKHELDFYAFEHKKVIRKIVNEIMNLSINK